MVFAKGASSTHHLPDAASRARTICQRAEARLFIGARLLFGPLLPSSERQSLRRVGNSALLEGFLSSGRTTK